MSWSEFFDAVLAVLFVLFWAVVSALALLLFIFVFSVGFSLMFGGHHA